MTDPRLPVVADAENKPASLDQFDRGELNTPENREEETRALGEAAEQDRVEAAERLAELRSSIDSPAISVSAERETVLENMKQVWKRLVYVSEQLIDEPLSSAFTSWMSKNKLQMEGPFPQQFEADEAAVSGFAISNEDQALAWFTKKGDRDGLDLLNEHAQLMKQFRGLLQAYEAGEAVAPVEVKAVDSDAELSDREIKAQRATFEGQVYDDASENALTDTLVGENVADQQITPKDVKEMNGNFELATQGRVEAGAQAVVEGVKAVPGAIHDVVGGAGEAVGEVVTKVVEKPLSESPVLRTGAGAVQGVRNIGSRVKNNLQEIADRPLSESPVVRGAKAVHEAVGKAGEAVGDVVTGVVEKPLSESPVLRAGKRVVNRGREIAEEVSDKIDKKMRDREAYEKLLHVQNKLETSGVILDADDMNILMKNDEFVRDILEFDMSVRVASDVLIGDIADLFKRYGVEFDDPDYGIVNENSLEKAKSEGDADADALELAADTLPIAMDVYVDAGVAESDGQVVGSVLRDELVGRALSWLMGKDSPRESVPSSPAEKKASVADNVRERLGALRERLNRIAEHNGRVWDEDAYQEATGAEGPLRESLSPSEMKGDDRLAISGRARESVDRFGDVADDVRGRLRALRESLRRVDDAGVWDEDAYQEATSAEGPLRESLSPSEMKGDDRLAISGRAREAVDRFKDVADDLRGRVRALRESLEDTSYRDSQIEDYEVHRALQDFTIGESKKVLSEDPEFDQVFQQYSSEGMNRVVEEYQYRKIAQLHTIPIDFDKLGMMNMHDLHDSGLPYDPKTAKAEIDRLKRVSLFSRFTNKGLGVEEADALFNKIDVIGRQLNSSVDLARALPGKFVSRDRQKAKYDKHRGADYVNVRNVPQAKKAVDVEELDVARDDIEKFRNLSQKAVSEKLLPLQVDERFLTDFARTKDMQKSIENVLGTLEDQVEEWEEIYKEIDPKGVIYHTPVRDPKFATIDGRRLRKVRSFIVRRDSLSPAEGNQLEMRMAEDFQLYNALKVLRKEIGG